MDHGRDHQSVRRLELEPRQFCVIDIVANRPEDRARLGTNSLVVPNDKGDLRLLFVTFVAKTGFRICPINDDLFLIGP